MTEESFGGVTITPSPDDSSVPILQIGTAPNNTNRTTRTNNERDTPMTLLLDSPPAPGTRLAAASAEAVRKHAKELDSHLGRCTEDVERFAVEAAQCSGAAHTLNDYINLR